MGDYFTERLDRRMKILAERVAADKAKQGPLQTTGSSAKGFVIKPFKADEKPEVKPDVERKKINGFAMGPSCYGVSKDCQFIFDQIQREEMRYMP